MCLFVLMIGYMIYSDIADYKENQAKLQIVEDFLDARGDLFDGLVAGATNATPEVPFFQAITQEDVTRIGVLSQNLLLGRDIPPPPASKDPLAPPVVYTPVTTDLDIFVQNAQVTPSTQPLGAWVNGDERDAYLLCQVVGGYGGLRQLNETQPWELGATLVLIDAKPQGEEPKITFIDIFTQPHTPEHDIQAKLETLRRGCLLDYLALFQPEALKR